MQGAKNTEILIKTFRLFFKTIYVKQKLCLRKDSREKTWLQSLVLAVYWLETAHYYILRQLPYLFIQFLEILQHKAKKKKCKGYNV